MRHLLLYALLAIGSLLPLGICSQPFFNLSGGVGVGSHVNLRASTDFVLPGNFSMGLTLQSHQRTAPGRPYDCDMVLSDDPGNPRESMVSVGGLLGYVRFDKFQKRRYHLRTGFVVNYHRQITNFRPANYSVDVWGPNYTYDSERSANFGVLIEPRVEFLNSQTIGLAVGLYANLNPVASSWGINLDFLIGRLK